LAPLTEQSGTLQRVLEPQQLNRDCHVRVD